MKSALPLALLSAISVSVFSSGCASIVNSGTKPGITVTTKVPGARVLVDGNEVGTTPLTVRPKGTGKHVVRVEGDGREPAETVMYKSWEPWFLGNLILGGIIGVAVDFGTGHWACYDPPEWNPDATPSGKTSDPALAEPAPAKAKHAKDKPSETKPAKAKPAKAKPVEPAPAKAKPAEDKSVVVESVKAESSADSASSEEKADEKAKAESEPAPSSDKDDEIDELLRLL